MVLIHFNQRKNISHLEDGLIFIILNELDFKDLLSARMVEKRWFKITSELFRLKNIKMKEENKEEEMKKFRKENKNLFDNIMQNRHLYDKLLEAEKLKRQCISCKTKQRNVYFQNCSHLLYCEECVQKNLNGVCICGNKIKNKMIILEVSEDKSNLYLSHLSSILSSTEILTRESPFQLEQPVLPEIKQFKIYCDLLSSKKKKVASKRKSNKDVVAPSRRIKSYYMPKQIITKKNMHPTSTNANPILINEEEMLAECDEINFFDEISSPKGIAENEDIVEDLLPSTKKNRIIDILDKNDQESKKQPQILQLSPKKNSPKNSPKSTSKTSPKESPSGNHSPKKTSPRKTSLDPNYMQKINNTKNEPKFATKDSRKVDSRSTSTIFTSDKKKISPSSSNNPKGDLSPKKRRSSNEEGEFNFFPTDYVSENDDSTTESFFQSFPNHEKNQVKDHDSYNSNRFLKFKPPSKSNPKSTNSDLPPTKSNSSESSNSNTSKEEINIQPNLNNNNNHQNNQNNHLNNNDNQNFDDISSSIDPGCDKINTPHTKPTSPRPPLPIGSGSPAIVRKVVKKIFKIPSIPPPIKHSIEKKILKVVKVKEGDTYIVKKYIPSTAPPKIGDSIN